MADEQTKEKKGFWKEFKEFIARGNVLDMAVGIIIGGAFTAIVNALCNNILKPIINWILAAIIGTDSLDQVYTFLRTAYTTNEAGEQIIDLANSIYIDWGTCINAIINFLLTALVLFLIIKAVMKVSRMREEAKKALEEAAEKHKAEKAAEEAAAAGANAADAAADTAEGTESPAAKDAAEGTEGSAATAAPPEQK